MLGEISAEQLADIRSLPDVDLKVFLSNVHSFGAVYAIKMLPVLLIVAAFAQKAGRPDSAPVRAAACTVLSDMSHDRRAALLAQLVADGVVKTTWLEDFDKELGKIVSDFKVR